MVRYVFRNGRRCALKLFVCECSVVSHINLLFFFREPPRGLIDCPIKWRATAALQPLPKPLGQLVVAQGE